MSIQCFGEETMVILTVRQLIHGMINYKFGVPKTSGVYCTNNAKRTKLLEKQS